MFAICYDQCILLAKLCKPLPCFILYSKAKLAYYSRYLLTFYFCILGPYNEKDIFFLVLVLEGLVGLHRTIQLQLLQHSCSGHRLGLLWYWMVCLGNEIISREWSEILCQIIILSFLRLHLNTAFQTLLLIMRATLFSKGFLPTVVDIMVIWLNLAIVVHFSSLILKMSMFTLVISCLTTSSLP